jgi:L-alanine-DL-glutamate epimerase-like enolase superfamily enzyme
VELTVERVRARLRTPFHAAWGSISERELVLVRLEDRSGHVGFGEAVPLPGYGGATVDEVCAALQRCAELLPGTADGPPRELIAACAALSPPPQAIAAIDLALWDLEGRRAGVPAWSLLGASTAPEIELNATIADSGQAASARAAGFHCIKAKVGLEADFERLAALRGAVGPDVAIRIDANGAWSVGEAVAALRRLEPIGIELCEEPAHGLDAIAQVADASSVPVALDESGASSGAFDRRVCDAVCLKIARCGGISGLLAAGERARAAGYRTYLASTLDGPLGIAAALHAAALLRPELPCGLATLGLFDRRDVLPPHRGRIAPPPGAGLGDGLVEWYRR